MAAQQEVTIAIDDSFTQTVCDYSVGFLRFRVDANVETAIPAGTGTFVKLGKIYGILTAGHVLAPFGKNEVVGLVRFPTVQPPLQNRRLNLDHTESLILWSGREGEAPDIAFLRIPEVDGRDLEAVGAVFYNLSIARKFSASQPEHQMSKCHAVVGVVGEWTDEAAEAADKGRKVNVGGLFGSVKDFWTFQEGGTDLVEFAIDAGPRIPNSYGGVSGGGFWELHVELDMQLKPVSVGKRLVGVPFRQSEDHRLVTRNAIPSIDEVTKHIAASWPDHC